jgi:hypothetical protein
VRVVILATEAEASHPFLDQVRVLPRAQVVGDVDAVWENVVIEGASAPLQPSQYAGPRRLKQLKLHRPAGFLLDDQGA